MKNKIYSTEEILKDIRSGITGRDKAITYLYNDKKLRTCIESLVYKMGGNKECYKDILSTTLMQFAKTAIQKKDLNLKCSLNSYIIGIARYVWLAQKRKEKKFHPHLQIIQEGKHVNSHESIVIKNEKYNLLHKLLERQGVRNKEILMYWAHGFKMKEIANLMNYKNAGVAKKKKYQSLKAITIYLENNPKLKAGLR